MGKVYRFGEHILGCGSSLDKEFVKEVLSDDKIDLVLTDPPYNIDYVNKVRQINKFRSYDNSRKFDDIINDKNINYRDMIKQALEAIDGQLSRTNSLYIFGVFDNMMDCRDVFKELGYHLSTVLIWVKNAGVLGRMDYIPAYELIVYGWKGRHKFYGKKQDGIIYCPKPQKSKLHPTMKPVSLLRKLIMNSSRVNDVVWDGFAGSGSTLLACEDTHRRFRGCELSEHYCDVIIDRWERYTGKKAKIT